jgi:hypothetical protein
LKRTFAAAVAAVTASTSMGLTATLRVVPRWTYQNGGKLAVIAGCSQRGDVRVISSKLLPRPVRMSKGGSLLIKVTGKTKPGKYEIVLLCADKHNQPDSVDMKNGQDLQSPRRFPAAGPTRPASGFQARCDRIQRASAGGAPQAQAEGALARQTSGPPRVARMLLVLSRATRGSPFQPVRVPPGPPVPPAPARGRWRETRVGPC